MTCPDFTQGLVVMLNRVNGVTCPNHLRMEASVLVRGVVDGAGGAICFKQLVVAFNSIAVTFLSLLLDVVSVWILHSILEFVFGVSLYIGHSRLTFISQWPRSLRRGSTTGRLLGLWARIPPVAWMFVSCECYMF